MIGNSPMPSSLPRHAIRFLLAALACLPLLAQSKPAPDPAPDVLVLSNGDTLHGKFVNEVAGKVTFHCDPLGDVSLGWDKIKELHTSQKFAVLDTTTLNGKSKQRGKKAALQLPVGTLEADDKTITVHPDNAAAAAPIPLKNAQYIMDSAELDKQVNHSPGFFTGWNGAATAGATLVTATQNQYTVAGGIGLIRVVPTVTWLNPRNRTSVDFTGSFGKITQPGYTSGTTTVAPIVTKSEIYHADAERDQYLAPRFFALGQLAYDHNFAQDLSLQQIYGGGFGWTAVKTPKQEADLKGTIQYEKQQFITGATGTNQNLIGSTLGASYILHLRLFTYSQAAAYIPSYNVVRAWSVNETNTFNFPAYKRLSFSLGTMDSFLNDPPVTLPPTQRNSFQFTMGLSYAIKSKY